jgi:hypothetical protein
VTRCWEGDLSVAKGEKGEGKCRRTFGKSVIKEGHIIAFAVAVPCPSVVLGGVSLKPNPDMNTSSESAAPDSGTRPAAGSRVLHIPFFATSNLRHLDGPLHRILIPSSSARAVKPSWQCGRN